MSGFSRTLRRIRLERQMTQEEFARFLGTSKQNISRYENGEVSPKISTAAQIAGRLGLTLTELNGEELPAAPQAPDLPNIVPLRRIRIPVINEAAMGGPSLPEDASMEAVEVDGGLPRCDFALRVASDEMAPTLVRGDLAFVRRQDDVEDGQIAAVRLEGSAALRRVHHIPGGLMLIGDNAAQSAPRVITAAERSGVEILGLVVSLRRDLIR